jgi:hypothetical protein
MILCIEDLGSLCLRAVELCPSEVGKVA